MTRLISRYTSMVREVGFEPTKAYAIAASALLLRPDSDTPASINKFYGF